jgi:hypothetical protein
MRAGVLAAVALTALACATAAAAAPNYTLKGDTDIGGFKLNRDATLRAAIDAYGNPSSRQPYEGQACIVTWATAGIRINFAHVVSDTPCDGRGCHSETRLTSTKWKTEKGLHVGDPLKKLRQLYRRAKPYLLAQWTLISRPLAGVRVPTLLATVRKSRVVSFVVESPWLLDC